MILVTGATGFIGKAVVQRLLAEDESLCLTVAFNRIGMVEIGGGHGSQARCG